MKKLSKNLAMYICMFVAVFLALTLQAEAANVTSGTIGDNGGVTWTYDADTKTLTLTGADSGLSGVWVAFLAFFRYCCGGGVFFVNLNIISNRYGLHYTL